MERTYTVPLRKEWLKAPKYKRAKKAMTALREFLIRHMKSEEVKLLPELNQEVWKDGIKSPPPRVKINVKKDDKGIVTAQLFGKNFPVVEEEPKKGKAVKKAPAKAEETVEKKVEEKAPEVKKATEKVEEKKVEEKKPVAEKAEEKKPEVKPVAEKKAPAEKKPEVKAEKPAEEKKEAKPEKAEKPKAE